MAISKSKCRWSRRFGYVAFVCSAVACGGRTIGLADGEPGQPNFNGDNAGAHIVGGNVVRGPDGGIVYGPDGGITYVPEDSSVFQIIDARSRLAQDGMLVGDPDAQGLPPLGDACGAARESLDVVCHVFYYKKDGAPPDSKVAVNPSQRTDQTSGDGYTFAVTLAGGSPEPPTLLIKVTDPGGSDLFHQTFQVSAREGFCNSTGYGFTGLGYLEPTSSLEIQYYCEHVY